MSRAISATTAKERARIAAAIMRSGREPTREFSNCFEMFDGDEVIEHLRAMAVRGPKLRAAWAKYLAVPLTAAETEGTHSQGGTMEGTARKPAYGANKIGNEYADMLGDIYALMPKAVLAAIAVSFASSGGDHLEIAKQAVWNEWATLYRNGIVRQKPRDGEGIRSDG